MEEKNNQVRQEAIHSKGFAFSSPSPVDYNKIKVGVKSLEDAVINLGSLKKQNQSFCDKQTILQAIKNKDYLKLREISHYFYAVNGIYREACDYASKLYRYDWFVEPEIFDITIQQGKVLKDFSTILSYLDNSHIRKMCGDIALKIILNGVFYGYSIQTKDKIIIQELPIQYCRSRYFVGDVPAIEFSMKFFDDAFKDLNYRMKVLKMFPEEFQKGYVLYKKGKLPADFQGDLSRSWYLLDPECAIKFDLGGPNEMPRFISTIPLLLDLDAAQDLDRKKQMQKLLKILIQKLPMDKNGDLIFDVDEARDIHNNAVDMLRRAIGVDVLTTFADVSVEDMSDTNTTTKTDDLLKVERTVYNSLGISQNLFNTEGNLSLDKSILTDELSYRTLVFQFERFLDRMVQKRNPNKKKYNFRFKMLETTQYNYKDLSKMYKEQTQLGFSKMLPQVAMGHNQSEILNSAYFENEILHLSEIMIPPLSSNVMSADAVLANKQTGVQANKESNAQAPQSNKTASAEKSQGGRTEKPDDQKSDKTIANRESMGK